VLLQNFLNKLKKAYDPIGRREKENKLRQEWDGSGVRPEAIQLWSMRNVHDADGSIYFDIAAAYLEDCDENLNEYIADQK